MRYSAVLVFGGFMTLMMVSSIHATSQLTHEINLQVHEGRFGFAGLTEVRIVLIKDPDPRADYSRMAVFYDDQQVMLDILPRNANQPNVFHAQLPLSGHESSEERFNVTLEYHNDFWLAQVRKGFGWCGTEDDVLHASAYGHWLP